MRRNESSQHGKSFARLFQLAELLELYCAVPSPVANFESLQRFEHLDIPNRDRAELIQERETLAFWLAMHPLHDEWFDGRMRLLDRALKHAA